MPACKVDKCHVRQASADAKIARSNPFWPTTGFTREELGRRHCVDNWFFGHAKKTRQECRRKKARNHAYLPESFFVESEKSHWKSGSNEQRSFMPWRKYLI